MNQAQGHTAVLLPADVQPTVQATSHPEAVAIAVEEESSREPLMPAGILKFVMQGLDVKLVKVGLYQNPDGVFHAFKVNDSCPACGTQKKGVYNL